MSAAISDATGVTPGEKNFHAPPRLLKTPRANVSLFATSFYFRSIKPPDLIAASALRCWSANALEMLSIRFPTLAGRMEKKGKKKHLTKQILSLHELFSAGEKPRIHSLNGRAPETASRYPRPMLATSHVYFRHWRRICHGRRVGGTRGRLDLVLTMAPP